MQVDGAASCAYAATITILQITASSFAAAFADATPGCSGEIRYDSTVGYKAAPSDFGHVNLYNDSGFPGKAQTVTFTGEGSDPITASPLGAGKAAPLPRATVGAAIVHRQ
jgi:hypothetical protein